MRNWKHWPIVAFLLLALAGGYTIDSNARSGADSLYRSQISACHRNNALRAQVSKNVIVLERFLRRAEVAWTTEGSKEGRKTAEAYAALEDFLAPIVQVDCEKVIEKP